MADDYIDIVFDGPPAPESGRFIEVEDASGASISVGQWVQRPDGYWALRIERAELGPVTSEHSLDLAARLGLRPETVRDLFHGGWNLTISGPTATWTNDGRTKFASNVAKVGSRNPREIAAEVIAEIAKLS